MKLKAISTALAVGAIGLGVAACGGSTASGIVTAPSGGATAPSSTPTSSATTSTPSTTTVATPKTGALSKEPVFSVPSKAPSKLEVKTIIPGSGPAAKDGDELSVNYVGKTIPNGKVFDASWKDTPGKTFGPFQLGAGAVIPGWDKGLVGVKQGSRVELLIPAADAYGKTGSKNSSGKYVIPPNTALEFMVDVVKVSK